MVADQLAKYGTTLVNITMLLLDSPPPFAMDAYQADLQGVATKCLVNTYIFYHSTTSTHVNPPQALPSVDIVLIHLWKPIVRIPLEIPL